jgi:hypothetical protein
VDPNTGGVQAGLQQFRNKIINGNFDIWQRGTTFNSVVNNTYNADKWKTYFDGTGATRNITQQAFSIGQTEVPGNPNYFLRMIVTVAGTGGNYLILEQPIEYVTTLSGKIMTLSFWAKSSSPITMQNTILAQSFNSSPAVFTSLRENIAITTSWSYYTVTGRAPSASGKTVGAGDYLGIRMYLPLNQVFQFDLAQVQVEEGQKATPFEVRPYPVELQLCMRYYEVGHSYVETNATTASPGIFTSFAVVKRAIPSISLYDDSNGGFSVTAYNRTTIFGFAPFKQNGVYMETGWKASADL